MDSAGSSRRTRDLRSRDGILGVAFSTHAPETPNPLVARTQHLSQPPTGPKVCPKSIALRTQGAADPTIRKNEHGHLQGSSMATSTDSLSVRPEVKGEADHPNQYTLDPSPKSDPCLAVY